GVYKPEEGEVKIFGENIFDNSKIKQRIFYVPDDIYFEPNATIESMGKFYEGYYPRFDRHTMKKLSEVFGLDTKKRINGFSKGMQRQAEIVLAMSTMPEVILLDESFDGLDPAKRNLIKNLLLEYMAEQECSVIISSHNLHELADLCDHIALINGKNIVLDCSVDDISGSRCKFRLIFDRDIEESDFKDIDIKHFSRDGKIITISANGDIEENEKKLEAMKPLMLEKFPLTLEEIFLEEMEGSDYDFKDIFVNAEEKK
ncbi:MAG: ABC transporter ATP-binding protein, partial [Oscillospiraceae bacterium]|nr:ABC transporter ATP-binding protein [Oscillospiraceae bacterium]